MQEYVVLDSFPTARAVERRHLETLMEKLAKPSLSHQSYSKTLKKILGILNRKRNAGNPDRFREEEVLRIMEQKETMTESFWEKGGYQCQ